jgi:hypothetical protein
LGVSFKVFGVIHSKSLPQICPRRPA